MGTQQVSIVDPDRHLEAQDQDALCVSWQSHARDNKVERRGANGHPLRASSGGRGIDAQHQPFSGSPALLIGKLKFRPRLTMRFVGDPPRKCPIAVPARMHQEIKRRGQNDQIANQHR